MSLIRMEHKSSIILCPQYKKTWAKFFFAEGQERRTTVSAKKHTEEIVVFESTKMLTFRKNSGR